MLVTDSEDSLTWERSKHDGWYVGLYAPEDVSPAPVRWLESEESSPEELLRLIDLALSGFGIELVNIDSYLSSIRWARSMRSRRPS